MALHPSAPETMRVELALLLNDELLGRGSVSVAAIEQTDDLGVFKATHRLVEGCAIIVLSGFAKGIPLRNSTLDMPVHESADWESIDLAGYTLAFRCSRGTASPPIDPDAPGTLGADRVPE